MTARHVLITGGAGFIGSHLTDVLIARGDRVTVLDDLRPQVHADAPVDQDGWPIYLNQRAKRVRGTVLDETCVSDAIRGVTHLVHLAASVGVGQSMTHITDYTRNNVMGAATVLEVLANRGHGVRQLIVASSMSIYGEGACQIPETNAEASPMQRTPEGLRARDWELRDRHDHVLTPIPTTESKQLQPASVYAVNKRDQEEMFLAVGRALDIPTVALRLFNVYGSRQALSNPYTGVAAIFIARLLNGAAPMVFEDGGQRRDFVHVSDVAAAFATVIKSEARVWDAFNVGSGQSITVRDIAETLAHLLGRNIAPQILGRYRVGDIRHCFADIHKAQRVFGIMPRKAFEDGMSELIDWVRTADTPCDRTTESLAALDRGGLLV